MLVLVAAADGQFVDNKDDVDAINDIIFENSRQNSMLRLKH
jgi:hypothetical protein